MELVDDDRQEDCSRSSAESSRSGATKRTTRHVLLYLSMHPFHSLISASVAIEMTREVSEPF